MIFVFCFFCGGGGVHIRYLLAQRTKGTSLTFVVAALREVEECSASPWPGKFLLQQLSISARNDTS